MREREALEMQTSYDEIIPTTVRYDDTLTANAKLLYGEIASLCRETGYCMTTNNEFACLYRVSKVSVSNWIGALVNHEYLKCELIYRGRQISGRRLSVTKSVRTKIPSIINK